VRHHYVPQFMLAAWAFHTPDRKVEVFRLDLPGLPSSRHSPKGTGYEVNLYALDRSTIAGMSQHAVETLLLKQIDNFAATARRKLDEIGPSSLTPDDRCDWVNFLMSLKVRLPHNVLRLKTESAAALRRTLAKDPKQYEDLRRSENPPTMEESVERRYPGLIDNYTGGRMN
jgi:Protein of unknown function (DUF4238)